MQEQQQDMKPWYKQFWPWFLIALPLSSVIAGITTFIIASNTTDSMVVDNYYKDGLAINESLAKQEKAKQLGVQATLVFSDELLTVDLKSNKPMKDSLFVDFQHSTLSSKDFKVSLTRDGKGQFYSQLNQQIDGSWYIKVYPYQGGWEIKKKVTLPSSTDVKLGY
ncbi:FixH family protein [Kangiella sediminilitoris]|uniref:FixH family protein n=1 Tax=Kangiella sediminilitoris TaxID=1144748 RepID=A0A1B3BCR3_9GAMM|nr:FixH family protein [Kangiella sediminilitoris]AOE50599.1 FixH family protein [Kangiella sediminilitoris]